MKLYASAKITSDAVDATQAGERPEERFLELAATVCASAVNSLIDKGAKRVDVEKAEFTAQEHALITFSAEVA